MLYYRKGTIVHMRLASWLSSIEIPPFHSAKLGVVFLCLKTKNILTSQAKSLSCQDILSFAYFFTQ